jgi:hypothetical protein
LNPIPISFLKAEFEEMGNKRKRNASTLDVRIPNFQSYWRIFLRWGYAPATTWQAKFTRTRSSDVNTVECDWDNYILHWDAGLNSWSKLSHPASIFHFSQSVIHYNYRGWGCSSITETLDQNHGNVWIRALKGFAGIRLKTIKITKRVIGEYFYRQNRLLV